MIDTHQTRLFVLEFSLVLRSHVVINRHKIDQIRLAFKNKKKLQDNSTLISVKRFSLHFI